MRYECNLPNHFARDFHHHFEDFPHHFEGNQEEDIITKIIKKEVSVVTVN